MICLTNDDNDLTAVQNVVSKRLPRATSNYPCRHQKCQKRFDTRAQMNKHFRSHIPETERIHKCPNCAKGFNDARDLKRHANRKTQCQIQRGSFDLHQDPSVHAGSLHNSGAQILMPTRSADVQLAPLPDFPETSGAMETVECVEEVARGRQYQKECRLARQAIRSRLVLEDDTEQAEYQYFALKAPGPSSEIFQFQLLVHLIRDWMPAQIASTPFGRVDITYSEDIFDLGLVVRKRK